MLVNAENLVLGRLASFVAKKALLGEKVDLVNVGSAVVVGRKEDIFRRYDKKRMRGHPYKGPFFPVTPEGIARRTIRGMLPFKRTKGREVYRNVRCYSGIPERFKNKEVFELDMFNILKSRKMRYVRLSDIAKHIGYKK